jgi:tetratricopeptide (TPR) repeat protein
MTLCRAAALLGCCGVLMAFPACEEWFDKGSAKNIELADKRSASGDYAAAVRLYEASLDGTVKTADVHYKLALIYADKLKSPIDALHHFKRYLDLSPSGAHAKEARSYRREGEQKLVADLTNGTPFTAEDAVKLKNQNLALVKALADLRAQKSATPGPIPPGGKKGEPVPKAIPAGARTHTVQAGETLGTIAQKYYKSKAKWKDIQDATFYPMDGTARIKPGMTLVIP